MDKYIDLHLHLDGAISMPIARELAEAQGIALPADKELESLLTVPEDCQSLNDFLKCFDFPLRLLQTREAIAMAVRLVLEELSRQGVIYAEIRFAPQLHREKGLSQEEAVLAALKGLEGSPLGANLILCAMRGGAEGENCETLRLTKKYLTNMGGAVAMDLAGAEALYPTEDYGELFAAARKRGVPFTVHAGEAEGARSIRAAVNMGAARIGHGVRLYEDNALAEEIIKRGIFLEMCPTSNRQTRAVADMSAYPLIKYLEMGVRVTLNTDDPAIEGTDIAKEYAYMEGLLGLTHSQKRLLLNNAVDAAFTDDATKRELRERIL